MNELPDICWQDDADTWAFLRSRGYSHNEGFISPPCDSHLVTDHEGEAIDYLCDEWDWSYVGKKS